MDLLKFYNSLFSKQILFQAFGAYNQPFIDKKRDSLRIIKLIHQSNADAVMSLKVGFSISFN